MNIASITPDIFFLEVPLYEKVSFGDADHEKIYDIIKFDEKVDCYCPKCNRTSTFKGLQEKTHPYEIVRVLNNSIVSKWFDKIFALNFTCTRNDAHLMQISVHLFHDSIMKIGQYPSIADLSIPDLRKYREVLSEEKFKEFIRGVGLVAHGVGVGAYVYLRRIFEELIEEAHVIAQGESSWDESQFQRSRMDEKIELLKSHLPSFLSDNKKLYSILSKGVHELTENECLEYFPTVKLGVELILDEKLEQKRRADKINHARKSINKLHGDLS